MEIVVMDETPAEGSPFLWQDVAELMCNWLQRLNTGFLRVEEPTRDN
jgi:hypothetical protein